MAISLVQLGIYKDIYEAKMPRRKKIIEDSNYEYKHLLYRE